MMISLFLRGLPCYGDTEGMKYEVLELCNIVVDSTIVDIVVMMQNAGVHSGDASLLLPAQKLWVETIRRVKRVASAICKALNISGPFNIQLMAKEHDIKVRIFGGVLCVFCAGF